MEALFINHFLGICWLGLEILSPEGKCNGGASFYFQFDIH